MFPKLLKPNRRGAWFFVLLIVVQLVLVFWFGSVTYSKDKTETDIGYGRMVLIRTTKDYTDTPKTAVRINWHWLALVLACTYLLATLVGHGVAQPVKSGRPRHVFPKVVGGTLLLALLASISISKAYWGYFLHRPPVDSHIVNAQRIFSLTPVSTQKKDEGILTFVIDPGYYIVKSGDISPGGYYELELRVIHALQERGKLPSSLRPLHPEVRGTVHELFKGFKWDLPGSPDPMPEEKLASLYPLVESTALIRPGTHKYESARVLSGIVIEAEGKRGENLLFIAVAGEQVSNDHYPYYEFLFEVPDEEGEPRLLSYKRFFYDNAGVEFLTLPFLFALFAIPGTVIAITVTVLVLVIRNLRRRTPAQPAHDTQPADPM